MLGKARPASRAWLTIHLPISIYRAARILLRFRTSWSRMSVPPVPCLYSLNTGNSTRHTLQLTWRHRIDWVAWALQWKARIGQLASKGNRENLGYQIGRASCRERV